MCNININVLLQLLVAVRVARDRGQLAGEGGTEEGGTGEGGGGTRNGAADVAMANMRRNTFFFN